MRKDPDTQQPERIAFASSEPDQLIQRNRPARWTELAVYYLHKPENPGRRWRAVVRGCSTYPHETTREEEITVGTLERALKLFDDKTQLGRSVIAQAGNWAEENIVTTVGEARAIGGGGRCATLDPGFDGDDQGEALRWLYGEELNSAKPQTLLARDFGVKESTARMQLGAGRPIMVPLTAALRYFNRPAFKKARGASADA
jgi:hypothetical protein